MVKDALRNPAPAELYRVAESIPRNGRRTAVDIHGHRVAIVRAAPEGAVSRRRRRISGFLAAYGSVPPLDAARTDTEMTEIAAEEAAEEAARAGFRPPHAGLDTNLIVCHLTAVHWDHSPRGRLLE